MPRPQWQHRRGAWQQRVFSSVSEGKLVTRGTLCACPGSVARDGHGTGPRRSAFPVRKKSYDLYDAYKLTRPSSNVDEFCICPCSPVSVAECSEMGHSGPVSQAPDGMPMWSFVGFDWLKPYIPVPPSGMPPALGVTVCVRGEPVLPGLHRLLVFLHREEMAWSSKNTVSEFVIRRRVRACLALEQDRILNGPTRP